MKARVKATGDIIEISEGYSHLYAENYDKSYNLNELEFLDVKEKSFPKDEPDYWEKLKHQYAVIFTKSFLDNCDTSVDPEQIIDDAINMATSLVIKLKLKEEEKCEK